MDSAAPAAESLAPAEHGAVEDTTQNDVGDPTTDVVDSAGTGEKSAPLPSSAQKPPPPSGAVEPQKKKRSKKDSKVAAVAEEHVVAANNTTANDDNNNQNNNNNTNTTTDNSNNDANSNNNSVNDNEQLPQSENKKSRKRSAKNKSPSTEGVGAAETAPASAQNPDDAHPQNSTTATTTTGDGTIPRARGFTAVNSVLPVASAKPTQPDEQLLSEIAAAASASTEKDPDGDVPMDETAPTAGKKQKRKRKEKNTVTEEQNEPEASAPQSSKKRRGKNAAANATEHPPETQVPATQEPEGETLSSTTVPAAEGSGNLAADENESQNQNTTSSAEPTQQAPEQPSGQEPGNGEVVESVPATQPEPVVSHQSAPRALTPPTATISNTAIESSPAVMHTPKPKSKVAIAYERKRKRLEAAAAAAAAAVNATSSPYGYSTAEGGDGMDLDVPNEEEEEVTSTPIREAPKSNKRKKRRMPDLNTPSRHVAVDDYGSPGDDEQDGANAAAAEGEGGAVDGSTPGPNRTPRLHKQSRAMRAPKTPKTPSNLPTIPQPGTTALSRKRASYTYAPDPAPATPPSTGTFTQPECELIDNYLKTFQYHNHLTDKALIARIWGDTSVVPSQTRAERESFWKDLYELFPHRKRLAIYNHVRRRYHNFDVQGAKWDEEQDAALANMVVTMGKKWTNIGRAMGRLPDDCRDRWRNYVKCGEGRREKEWTEEEEAKLREVVAEVRESLRKAAETRGETLDTEVEPNWTVVSEKMGGWRSRIQCRYKWSKMLEWEGKARLPDVEGGEGGEAPARKVKTQRKRVPKNSAATVQAEALPAPAEDEVPIDPALADVTIPTVPATTTTDTPAEQSAPASKKLRAKRASKQQAADAASAAGPSSSSAPPAHGEEDNTTLLASQQMLTGDRIWLLESILAHKPETPSAIPWDQLAAQAPHKHWTARGLERAFGKIVKKGISRRERDGLGVVEGVERLLRELGELPESVRNERWEPEMEQREEEEGAAVAASVKGKGKAKGKRGRKPKAAVEAAVGGEEGEAAERGTGAGGGLKDAVKKAMEENKEREKMEEYARVLLSTVQEAYETH